MKRIPVIKFTPVLSPPATASGRIRSHPVQPVVYQPVPTLVPEPVFASEHAAVQVYPRNPGTDSTLSRPVPGVAASDIAIATSARDNLKIGWILLWVLGVPVRVLLLLLLLRERNSAQD
jgi:hypothetical protein